MRKIAALFILVLFMATLVGCVLLKPVPPGQIKKGISPGHLRK